MSPAANSCHPIRSKHTKSTPCLHARSRDCQAPPRRPACNRSDAQARAACRAPAAQPCTAAVSAVTSQAHRSASKGLRDLFAGQGGLGWLGWAWHASPHSGSGAGNSTPASPVASESRDSARSVFRRTPCLVQNCFIRSILSCANCSSCVCWKQIYMHCSSIRFLTTSRVCFLCYVSRRRDSPPVLGHGHRTSASRRADRGARPSRHGQRRIRPSQPLLAPAHHQTPIPHC